MDAERSPFGAVCLESAVLAEQVTSGNGLGAKPVEKRHLRAAGDAEVLAVRVLHRLFLLRRLRDHFDAVRGERADVGAVAVDEVDDQVEVLSLVLVADVESLCRTVVLK